MLYNYIMENKDLLFVCVFDNGSRELGLNHLISLKNNNINNYIAYVTDDETYNYIKQHGFNAVKENIDDIITKKSKDFGTDQFNMFSYIRYKVINRHLLEGKSVWYMDVDTVVLGDLNLYYNGIMRTTNLVYDVIFQNDLHMVCTGCSLYNPNTSSIDFTKYVYDNASNKMNDQNFIADLIMKGKSSLKYNVFDYMEFANGLLYFKETDTHEIPEYLAQPKRRFRADDDKNLYFVHANWMIGNNVKMSALKNANLWFVK